MQTFWLHGYEATSVAMLRLATGLTQPQIYNAFTDKETLFRRALDRYLEREAMFAIQALSADIPTSEAIRDLLFGAARAYAAPGKPGGCLFVTGALASSPQAQAVADELKARRKASEAAIADRLARGQAEGDLPAHIDVLRLAKYLTSVIHGMSIQARDGASIAELEELASMALAVWQTKTCAVVGQ